VTSLCDWAIGHSNWVDYW